MKILENIFIYTFMLLGVLLYQTLRSLQKATALMKRGSRVIPMETHRSGGEARLAVG